MKTINGFVDPKLDPNPGNLSVSVLIRANKNPGDVHGTFIQWDGPPQRVLTVDAAMKVVDTFLLSLPLSIQMTEQGKHDLREALAKSTL